MSDEYTAIDEAQIDDEETTFQDTEDVEELKAELARKNQAVRDLTIRAKKAEAKAKQTKSATVADDALLERLERQDIRIAGYNDEETDFIMKNGGKAALDSKFVQAAIENLREKSRAEQASITGDTAKSEIEKRMSKDQFAGMNADEMETFIRQNS